MELRINYMMKAGFESMKKARLRLRLGMKMLRLVLLGVCRGEAKRVQRSFNLASAKVKQEDTRLKLLEMHTGAQILLNHFLFSFPYTKTSPDKRAGT